MIKFQSDLHSLNDTPYLALMGAQWGVFYELYKEKWPKYIESTLYYVNFAYNC